MYICFYAQNYLTGFDDLHLEWEFHRNILGYIIRHLVISMDASACTLEYESSDYFLSFG